MDTAVQGACAATVFDVSNAASLRRRLGHAATALKVIGFVSGIDIWVYLSTSLGAALSIAIGLLSPGFAALVGKRLRSGRKWAVVVATIWLVVYAGSLAFDALPKAARYEITPYTVVGVIMLTAPVYFLARGLIEFAIYHIRSRSPSPSDPLALNPYEEGQGLKERPKFINKKSIAAYGLLFLAPLPFLLVWISQFGNVKIYDNYAELLGATVALVGIFLLVAMWCVRIYRRARRAAMLPGSALMKKDTRPIVLYLRSFQDDSGIKLRGRATNGRILPERLVKIPFEEIVTDHLWSFGPVLAIGDPQLKSKAAPLGAARDYVGDADWQQKVIELMGQAAMIVLVAGRSEGLGWELDTVAKLGLARKLVIILPPVDIDELRARWQAVAKHIGGDVVSHEIDFARLRAVIFPNDRPALIVGKKRNDWTYEAALDEAALMIARERSAVQTEALPVASARRQAWRNFRSDLGVVIRPALVMGVLALVVMAVMMRNMVVRPYASAGRDRDSFIAEMTEACRRDNPTLDADGLAKYCTCFTKTLADTVTFAEVSPMGHDMGPFETRMRSAASACTTQVFGQ